MRLIKIYEKEFIGVEAPHSQALATPSILTFPYSFFTREYELVNVKQNKKNSTRSFKNLNVDLLDKLKKY